jgi:hypothetical protein
MLWVFLIFGGVVEHLLVIRDGYHRLGGISKEIRWCACICVKVVILKLLSSCIFSIVNTIMLLGKSLHHFISYFTSSARVNPPIQTLTSINPLPSLL